MPKSKTRTPPKVVDRASLLAGFVSMSSSFTWSELAFAIGFLGSETHLRHLLLDEWKWIERTDQTRPTEILRKGKRVGGRPQTVYRKTDAGKAVLTPPATMSR